MRVLELGSYLVPAYAGMVLAEQGHRVEKWARDDDPILRLRRGSELWAWVNHGKTVVTRGLDDVTGELHRFDVVVDNVRPDVWERRGVDIDRAARANGVRWVSMRPDRPGRSFDLIAQARATAHLGVWAPFYLGDTAGGLWLAFKAVADTAPGLFVVEQAAALAKLVEGELVVDRPAGGWDPPGTYGPHGGAARVVYGGEEITEPVRDRAWQWEHLRHDGAGRFVI